MLDVWHVRCVCVRPFYYYSGGLTSSARIIFFYVHSFMKGVLTSSIDSELPRLQTRDVHWHPKGPKRSKAGTVHKA